MFLANMSHEIRTPMNAVLGMLQLLHRTQLSGRQVDYLAKASSAARSMLELIDEILDLSKIEADKLSLEPRNFQVDELLRDTAPLLNASIGDKPVEVLFNVSPELPKVLEGDLLRLKQVLVNLGGNAIKFTAQGKVVVSVDVDRIERDQIFVRFCVEDTGIGMSPEQQLRIFQPFTQAEVGTTRRFGGTGLGLAISQRLVELMGGELRLESETGRGTKFWFVVGLGGARTAMDSLSEPTGGPLAEGLQALRTLVVDDDDLVRAVLGRLAKTLGWEVDLCASGAEAVHRFEQSLESGPPYQLALIDWRMPELDGWETAGLIRNAQRPGAPLSIVMVTGHADEMLDSMVDQDPTRIDAVLVKPITRSDLLEAATRALSGSASDCGRQHSQGHESARQLAGLRLLVVEDNPINQQVARELLADEGAEVEVVASGRSAIERLRIDPSRCDAILMDIQMPRLDGYDTTRQIRDELGLKDLPILAMTANVMATDRELALAAGMNDHIGKPFEVDEMVEKVLALCSRGRRSVAPRPKSQAEPSQMIHRGSMPEIEGFGLHRALQRIANKGDLFSRLVKVFVSEFEGEGKTVSALLQQTDHAAARNRLHTLRGVAANLGAEALAEAASDLEVAIKDQQTPAELQRRSGTLASRLAEACATLVGVADKLEASSGPFARYDAADASTQLQDLERHLADSNMRAVEVHAQLRPYLSDLHGELASELDEAMNQLDFRTAFHRVHDLLDHASRSPIQAGTDTSEPSSLGATP
jgi:CheY-like chemotaxis protein/two-component sensor histidine kinase